MTFPIQKQFQENPENAKIQESAWIFLINPEIAHIF
jgi:hypothetical protein